MSFSIGDRVRPSEAFLGEHVLHVRDHRGVVVGVHEEWAWVQADPGSAPFPWHQGSLELDVLRVGDRVRVRKGDLPIYFSATGTLVHIHGEWALIDGEGFRHPELRPLKIMELDR